MSSSDDNYSQDAFSRVSYSERFHLRENPTGSCATGRRWGNSDKRLGNDPSEQELRRQAFGAVGKYADASPWNSDGTCQAVGQPRAVDPRTSQPRGEKPKGNGVDPPHKKYKFPSMSEPFLFINVGGCRKKQNASIPL